MLGVAFEPEAIADFISGPSEAADFKASGIGDLKAGFEFTLLKESLDHGVAVEEDGGVFVGLLSECFLECFYRFDPAFERVGVKDWSDVGLGWDLVLHFEGPEAGVDEHPAHAFARPIIFP